LHSLDPTSDAPPFDLQDFNIEIFSTFLVSLKKANGEKPKILKRYGVALTYLFTMFDVQMCPAFALQLKGRMKALGIEAAERIQSGRGSIKEGKDPLPFNTYRFIGEFTLENNAGSKRETLFTRMFTILSWNLMCRATNTKRIHLNHMEWRGDALVIRFCNSKKDQTGDHMQYPRHIYPNPIMPEICPILALGMFWLVYPFSPNEPTRQFFTGNDQYSRYTQSMSAIKRNPIVLAHLESHGLDPTLLGSHSNRKGACSLCSSGSTAGPSAVSLKYQ
jgi:hypothetical protein